jgi:gamma-glutamylcyclotransferase (GGCT)/AIG2-like uncharacterized protein YtfP
MDLFFYGVLREGLGDWPFLAGIGPGRAASATGTIFAIPDPQGWYPALLPGDGVVHGAVHAQGQADLAAMDAFEGPRYRRQAVPVMIAGATVMAEAYCWIDALPGGTEPIAHGDFARWLAETGRRPLGSD